MGILTWNALDSPARAQALQVLRPPLPSQPRNASRGRWPVEHKGFFHRNALDSPARARALGEGQGGRRPVKSSLDRVGAPARPGRGGTAYLSANGLDTLAWVRALGAGDAAACRRRGSLSANGSDRPMRVPALWRELCGGASEDLSSGHFVLISGISAGTGDTSDTDDTADTLFLRAPIFATQSARPKRIDKGPRL
jgi:hypothetical protein